MNQNVAANLMLGDEGATRSISSAWPRSRMVDSLRRGAPDRAVPARRACSRAASPRDETPFHETQLVFANSPQTPVIDTDSDCAQRLHGDARAGAGKPGDFEVDGDRPRRRASRSDPLNEAARRTGRISLGDGDPVMFRVAKYWPDFAMKNGVPVSLSDKPSNPAVLVQITGPTKLLPAAPPKPAAAAPPMPKGLAMRIAPAKEPGRIVYELEREGKIEARGTAAQGETIQLGWSKWEARVDAVLPHAELHREMKEFTGDGHADDGGVAAHRACARIWSRRMAPAGRSEWIPAGTSRELFTGHDFACESASASG